MTSHETVQTNDYCRACRAADPTSLDRLRPVLPLGAFDLSAFPVRGAGRPYPQVPLTLCVCPRCTLVQLRHTTPFSWLFGGQYWYRSGVNEMMRAELASVAAYAAGTARVLRGDNAVVVDIGANDGTLLTAYRQLGLLGVHRVAFEPSAVDDATLRERCESHYAQPFPPENPGTLNQLTGKVSVITACAMIYDLDDPVSFFCEIERLLTPDGVCVVQFQDLLQMLERTAFDCICHEHLEYYSLYALATLLNHCGLWVTDVEPRAINGGSLRVTIRKRGAGGHGAGGQRVLAWLQREADADLGTVEGVQRRLGQFAGAMGRMRQQIRGVLAEARAQGLTVDLYGASTKGNTLLQYLGLDRTHLRQAWERSLEKVERQVGYTGIPIVDESAGRHDPPGLLLCTIWQFREAILAREAQYLSQGGAILFPLPGAEVVRVAAHPSGAEAVA